MAVMLPDDGFTFGDDYMRLVVMDVMPLLYRGNFAFLKRPRLTSSGINTSAIFILTSIVRELLESGATHAAMAMDTSPTFRHERFPEYKAKREKLPEDIANSIPMAMEFAEAMRIPFLKVQGYEADDVMGTVAEIGKKAGIETWLVTPDKDIAQLVSDNVFLCRPAKGNSGGHELFDSARVCSEWGLKEPAQMIDLLGMAGDSTDNIPGFQGVGPKTASELLDKYGSLENVIEHASELKGKLSDKVREGAEQARLSRWLAKICTDVPIGVGLDDLRIREPDADLLLDFCEKYELAALYGKITGKPLPHSGGARPAAVSSAGVPAEHEDRKLDTIDTVPHTYTLCDTEEKLALLCSKLSSVGEFAFDTETTGLDPRKSRPVGFSFSVSPHEAFYVPVGASGTAKAPENAAGEMSLFDFAAQASSAAGEQGGEQDGSAGGLPLETLRKWLGPVFSDAAVSKIGHNIKFDLHVMNSAGIKVAGRLSDTMLAHYVLDPAARHGMDPLAREYLRYDPIPITALIGEKGDAQISMDKVPVDKVCDYAAEDADVTLQLYSKLVPKVAEAGASRAYEDCENKLVRVLFEMESEGVRIDEGALRRFGAELQTDISRAEHNIFEKTGVFFNVASPVQLANVIYDKLGLVPYSAKKTSGGRFSTSEDVLQELAGQHPVIEDILEYRLCTKLKSTYVDKLPKCVDPSTGRIHTSFNQALTETGRLSSDNPNLQNIPIRTARGRRIREAFIARDSNHVILSADYSQIELRMMAALSGDAAMTEAFNSDDDIHLQTAARVYGVERGDVSGEMRSRAKMVNFGIIYGISPFGLAQRLGIARTTAGDLIRSYFEMYPGVKSYIDRTIASAREKGYVSTITGRRRPLKDINSRNGTVRAGAERIAVNTPVQGSAADLIKLAMSAVYDEMTRRGLSSKMILQVHDELVFDVPRDEITIMRELVESCMTGVMELPVPLKVEIGVGDNWLEAH